MYLDKLKNENKKNKKTKSATSLCSIQTQVFAYLGERLTLIGSTSIIFSKLFWKRGELMMIIDTKFLMKKWTEVKTWEGWVQDRPTKSTGPWDRRSQKKIDPCRKFSKLKKKKKKKNHLRKKIKMLT